MKVRKQFLMDLLEIDNPSGMEKVIIPTVVEELTKLNFNVTMDSMGNVYAERGITSDDFGKVVLLNAHLDQVDLSWWGGYYSSAYSTSGTSRGKNYYDKNKDGSIYTSYKYRFINDDDLDDPFKVETLEDVYDMMTDSDKKNWFACSDCECKDCEARQLGMVCDLFRLKEGIMQDAILLDVADSWGLEIASDYDNKKDNYKLSDDELVEAYLKGEKPKESFFVYESKGKIYGTGGRVLGGDDKCGIFIALEVARVMKDEPMKILFTVQEEEGCVGIRHAIKENRTWFDDIAYSITIDRREGNHLLWSQCGKRSCSNAFAGRLALAGISVGIPIEIKDGSVADVIYIRDIVPEAVNISAGYHDPHSEEEYVVFDEVVLIIKWVRRFIVNEKLILNGGN